MLSKFASARYLIALMLSTTLCWGFIIGKVPSGTFLPVVLLALGWYFERKDRKEGNHE